MAATYTTDLTNIALAESGETWGEPTGATGGGVPSAETDYYIQQAACFSKTMAISGGGIGGMGTLASSGQSITTPQAVFVWIFFGCPNTLDLQANGGLRIIIGSSSANYYAWYVKGSDTYTYGGWVNIAVDPTVASQATQGTPTGTLQYFGTVASTLATISKGSPFGTDTIRFGRTLQIVGGDISGYGTFSGAAAKNDANDATEGYNRWGLFQAIDGGYLMKGLFLMGTSGTAVDFRDSNKVISIQDTLRTVAGFNEFEIRNASSRVDWTNISISALGTTSKGKLTVTDNADVNFESCTFTDMDTFTFQSNSTILSSTFRRCGQITGGGGTFDTCTITNGTAAVSLALTNLNQATDCTFVSDGTNHAIDLGTVSSTTSMNWNNYLTGYAVSDGSSGNEAIKVSVASSQTLTINVGAGYSTPSVYNTGSGTVSVVSGQVTTSVTVQALSDGSDIFEARVLVWATDASNKFYNASVTITGSGTTATVSHTGHGLVTGDYVIISGVTNDDDYNGVHQITKINDDSYSYTADETLAASPATGTILVKWAIISGTTDTNGYIEDVRSFGSPQPIQGWVRKTSGSPYYQQGAISGTINTSSGFSVTVQLATDE